MARPWVNECGNALDVELSAGLGEVEGRGRRCDDDLRLAGSMPSGLYPVRATNYCSIMWSGTE